MDAPTIILAALVIAPMAVLLGLRVNATLVFLSLCLGNILIQFVARDTSNFLILHPTKISSHASGLAGDTIKLALLLIPVILTSVFMIRTVHGRGRLALNALPSLGVGMLGTLLVVPLLPSGLSHNIIGSALWVQVTRFQDIIVGASAVVCLLVLWLQRPKTGGKHGKHNKD